VPVVSGASGASGAGAGWLAGIDETPEPVTE
jgi:hypothetical protein